jgi:predicted 2-oxoglutarate/Fe(II)-dependent dioxygenase YbiX/peroxiredoxin
MTPLPTVGVGEPIPWFSAATDADSNNSIAIDELAGRYIVLFFFGSASHTAVSEALGELGRRTDLFDGKRGLLVAVSSDRDDIAQSRFPVGRLGQFYLLDQTAAAARRYGITEPTAGGTAVRPFAFILSPALQAIEIVQLKDPREFVAGIDSALKAQLSAPDDSGTAPVLIVPRVFDRDFCRRLTDLYEAAGGREIGAIEKEGKIVERFHQQFRKRFDYYITDEAAVHRCRELLSRRLLPMVYRAFQFRTTRIERYLVGCYDGTMGGYFRSHRDNTAPIVAHRRFALTIVLNDDYDGGDLTFPEFGNRTYRASPGDGIVFSCALLHEVTPVTQGRRYSFITFFYDEASHRMREEFTRSMAGTVGGPRP